MKAYIYEEKTSNDGWEVIYRCLNEGPAYAKWCKKRLQLGFLNAFSMEDEGKDEYGELYNYKDMFPHDHLIHWVEEDPLDLVNSLEYKACNPTILNEYREKLKLLISSIEITPIPDEIIQMEGGTSVCYNSEKYRGYARLKDSKPSFARKMLGRRSVIRVGPANSRDSYILSRESSNSVSKISKLIRQIVFKLDCSAMKNTEVEYSIKQKKEDRYFYKTKCSYLRDFKKAGLTISHDLINTTREVLEEKYPELGFDLMSILTDQLIELDADIYPYKKGDKISPLRGHGLGMGNELATLIQCVMIEMSLDKAQPEDTIMFSTYNDDYKAIGYERDLRKLKKFDIEICEGLGWKLSSEKTRILKGASVFMEEYITSSEEHNYSKIIRDYLSLIDSYFAYNVVHAKELLRDRVSGWIESENEDLLREISSLKEFWGYEFFREEALLTDTFGGWKRITIINMDESFDFPVLDKVDYTDAEAAIRAENVTVTLRKDKRYSPHKYLKNTTLKSVKIPKHHQLLCPHANLITGNTFEIADQTWQGLTLRQSQAKYYQKLYLARQVEFKKRYKKISLVELFNSAVKNFPNRRFSIPESLIIQKKDWGLNLEDLSNYCMYGSMNEFDFYDQIKLESRLIMNETDLSDVEWLELLHRSNAIPCYHYNHTFETSREVVINDDLYKYYMNHLLCQAYYILNIGGIPTKIHPDIILLDNMDKLQVPSRVYKTLKKLSTHYPTFLNQEEAMIIERILSYHKDIDRFDLYNLLEDLYSEIPEGLKIELSVKDCFADCFIVTEIETDPYQFDFDIDEIIISDLPELLNINLTETILDVRPDFLSMEFADEGEYIPEAYEEENYSDIEYAMEFSSDDESIYDCG
jgi:hypothetical protein